MRYYLLGYSPEQTEPPKYDKYDSQKKLRYRLVGNAKEYEPVVITTEGCKTRTQLDNQRGGT